MEIVVYDLGQVSDWLIAIGTIGAVIVSLYFSYNSSSKKAKVLCRLSKDHLGKVYEFRIINRGFVPLEISSSAILIHKPFWKRREKEVVELFRRRKPKILKQSESTEKQHKFYDINESLRKFKYEYDEKVKLIYAFRDTAGKIFYVKFDFVVQECKSSNVYLA